jgi:hypothetical protein
MRSRISVAIAATPRDINAKTIDSSGAIQSPSALPFNKPALLFPPRR